MKRPLKTACYLWLAILPACDGSKPVEPGASPDELIEQAQPTSALGAPEGWGGKLLRLVPERGDDSTPSLATVRTVFKDCGLGNNPVSSGRCDLSARSPSSPSAPSVAIEIEQSGSEARAIRLTACCSADADFFRPVETESVIRTELICPELTIVSSESIHAYRVSSAGKRDFVYARASRSTPKGRQVELIILLSRVEQLDECSALAAAYVGPTGSAR